MSVKVAIRVRPFNQRQIQLNSKCCVVMDGQKTTLMSPENQKREYSFDYSIWSHDGFTALPNGLMVPNGQKYWDQTRLYNQIGTQVIRNAWQGYNCCLFAYGQTGSGKSYSMIGYGVNKGIVPLTFQQIFSRIQNNNQINKHYEVTMSMIEIYNQKVQDLLIQTSKRTKSGLQIRQNKTLGVYVQGMTKHRVNSFRQIQKWMDLGARHRSLASTQMNQYSSRAHTIISLDFVQRQQLSPKQVTQKSSTIHLIDLAGSQRVGKTGVGSADRLKEAGNINKSLHHLGLVIEILAEKSQGRRKNQIVSYRSSVLTRILQNSLGGNSKTIMICAISPSNDNYQQSLSTLKYADQVKKIKNNATVNESSTDKLIRELKSENDRLKKMIEEFNQKELNGTDLLNFQNQQQQVQKKLKRASIAMKQFDISISTDENLMNTIYEQQPSFLDSQIFKLDQAYITNLNEDQMLTGRLKYRIQDDNGLIIGRKDGNPVPQVVLGAVGIQKNHAKIYKRENAIYISTFSQNASERTFVNGQNVYQSTQLFHNDRIIFGASCVFLMKTPSQICRNSVVQNEINYQYAIRELQQLDKNRINQEQNELNQKLKALQAQMQAQKKLMEQKITKQKQVFQKQLNKLTAQNQKQNLELLEILKKKQNEEIKLMIQKQEIESVKLRSLQLEQELQNERKNKQRLSKELEKIITLQKEIQLKKKKQQKQYEQQRILRDKITRMRKQKQDIQNRQIKLRKQKQEKQKQRKQAQKKYQQYKLQQIRRTEDTLRKKYIISQNLNILNQRYIEFNKRSKQIQQLRLKLIKKQKIQLQKKLVQILPMVTQMNLITKQMNKSIEIDVKIDYQYFGYYQLTQIFKNQLYKGKLKLRIIVRNIKQQSSYSWTVDKFKNRLNLAKQMLQKYCEDPNNPIFQDKDRDPFWDPPESQLIGQAFISLEHLMYGLDYRNNKLNIIGDSICNGYLQIYIYPTNQSGSQNLSSKQQKSNEIIKPRSWLQKNMYFVVSIGKIQLNQPANQIYIQYQIPQNNYKVNKFSTNKIQIQFNKFFNYKQKHTIKSISETTIYYLSGSQISFKVYATKQKRPKMINLFKTPQKQDYQRERAKTTLHKGQIYQNTDILMKIEKDYNEQEKKNIKGNNKEKCIIF